MSLAIVLVSFKLAVKVIYLSAKSGCHTHSLCGAAVITGNVCDHNITLICHCLISALHTAFIIYLGNVSYLIGRGKNILVSVTLTLAPRGVLIKTR